MMRVLFYIISNYILLFSYYVKIIDLAMINNNNNTQIAAIALPPSTTHPQLWAELLTF